MLYTYKGHYNLTADITPEVSTLKTRVLLEFMERHGMDPRYPIKEQLEKLKKEDKQ